MELGRTSSSTDARPGSVLFSSAQPFPPWSYEPDDEDPDRGSGLASASLAAGLGALALCPSPAVQGLAFALALLGLALGIPALVGASGGTRSGLGRALAGLVLSILAVLGVVVAQTLSGAETARSPAGRSAAPPTTDEPLPWGRSAEVGDYTVRVDSVKADADEVIAETNEFNEPPDDRYVLVNATVTYHGGYESGPAFDLSAAIVTADGREYASSSTAVVTPRSTDSSVLLEQGGTTKVDFAMDVPPLALRGARVVVRETLSAGSDDSGSWAVQNSRPVTAAARPRGLLA